MTADTHTPVYPLRGLPIHGFRDIAHALDYLYPGGSPRQGALFAINAEKMLMLEQNLLMNALIHAAEYRYADGISVVRSLRKKYPQAQLSRVAGVDLWQALMQRAGQKQTPVYLLGSKPDTLSQTENKLRRLWQVSIAGSQHGYFTTEQQSRIFAQIRDSGAQLISVAMGSPRQEIFIRDCRQIYPDALYMGVGGSYDVFTGQIKRAPLSWQNLGLEWLYRLLSQPARLKRQLKLWRYLYWHYSGQL